MIRSGTYKAIVKDNTDATGNGRIRVYIPEFGGNPSDESTWYVVSYMSPHASNTNPYSNTEGGKSEMDSQDAYGMWMSGYHLENEVVVGFLDGNDSQGVVLGGLFQQNMVHSMGGGGFSKTPEGEFLPTVEYNKRDPEVNPDDPERPLNVKLWTQLLIQGLIADPLRTTMNSSVMRDLVPQLISLKTARGSSFIFDDGKLDVGGGAGINSRVYARQQQGGSSLIQMRTEGGAQTTINDDCGFIHMTSSNGNSTMQLSDNGVTYFSEGHLAIRVQGDYVNQTDGDASFETNGPTSWKVGGDMAVAALKSFGVKDGGPGINKHTEGEYTTRSKSASIVHETDAVLSYKAGGKIMKTASQIDKNTGGGITAESQTSLQKSDVMSVQAEEAPPPNVPVNEPVIRQAATTEETTLPADGLATHDPAPNNRQTCGKPSDAAEMTEENSTDETGGDGAVDENGNPIEQRPEDQNGYNEFTEKIPGEKASVDALNELNNELIAQGWTKEQRAAIIGSFIVESNGLDTRALGDRGTALGLAQWRHDRRDNLFKFASQNGMDPYSITTQAKFMNAEMTRGVGFGAEARAGDMLRNATTVDQAMSAMKAYERYGVAGRRYTLAQQVYRILP